MKKIKTNIIVFFVILLLSVSLNAYNFSNPKSIALGDAFLTKATGFYSLDWNPANLGLVDNYISINLFHFNTSLSNNSFNISFYNNLMGKKLSEDDKKDILDRIPDDGLELIGNSAVNIPLATFSVWKLALSQNIHILTSVNFSKELFDIALNGNEIGRVYDFSESDGEVTGFLEAKIGYGDLLPLSRISPTFKNIPPIYGGISFGYILGLAYAEVVEAKSKVAVYDSAGTLDANAVLRTAGYNSKDEEFLNPLNEGAHGTGHRMSIGFYSPITKEVSVGLAFNNLFGKIKWNKNCEEHIVSIYTDTLTIQNIEDVETENDTSYAIDGFTQKIPFELHLGGSYKFNDFLFLLDYIQGFKESAFTSSKPKISLGAEYFAIGWLPIRTGFGFGGGRPAHFSLGSGLEFNNFEFNWAVRNYYSLFNFSKGIDFAIGMLLKFN